MKAVEQRASGRFYTQDNPFDHKAFRAWAFQAGLPRAKVLEPFAGENSLIRHLKKMDLCKSFQSFDIQPGSKEVKKRDTLKHFPLNYKVCVTNPPWLARNVATRLNMPFPSCAYQDIYAFALEKCLSRCGWVSALVPESFLRAGLFRDRLMDFISLTSSLFSDTSHPVGLALFGPQTVEKTKVWSGEEDLGCLSDLEALRPKPDPKASLVRFNDPEGNVGLLALDNTRSASIRFCLPAELKDYKIRPSCRSITLLKVSTTIHIKKWNKALQTFREKTCDTLMTPYRGLREDGKYRRRCDWDLARGIIHHA